MRVACVHCDIGNNASWPLFLAPSLSSNVSLSNADNLGFSPSEMSLSRSRLDKSHTMGVHCSYTTLQEHIQCSMVKHLQCIWKKNEYSHYFVSTSALTTAIPACYSDGYGGGGGGGEGRGHINHSHILR